MAWLVIALLFHLRVGIGSRRGGGARAERLLEEVSSVNQCVHVLCLPGNGSALPYFSARCYAISTSVSIGLVELLHDTNTSWIMNEKLVHLIIEY